MRMKRNRIRKGAMSLFMTAIMVVAAVGFIVNGITAQAINPATFTIEVTFADGVQRPLNYNVAWELLEKSTHAAPTNLVGEQLTGSFNETSQEPWTITFNTITPTNANEYELKLTAGFAGLTIRNARADITNEMDNGGPGRVVGLEESLFKIRIEPAQNSNPGGPGGQGQNPPAQYSNQAKIVYSAPQGEWSCHPMVRDRYNDNSVGMDDANHVAYSKYVYTAGVYINDGGQRTQCASQYNYEEAGNYDSQYNNQVIGYTRDASDTTVDITFFTVWGNMFEGNININGTDYPVANYVDYSNRNSYLTHIDGQTISFTINVPVSNILDTDGTTEIYNIDMQLRPIEESECFVGNFLWSSDPRMAGDDTYIGHSELELLSVTYDDGANGLQTKSIDELKRADGSSVYPFIQIDTGTNNSTGIERGSMFIPEGSWVTMKISPEYGYQVKSFDVNGESVRTGDESVFSFEIGKGNFHIGAHVEKVEDEARVNAADVSISGAEVELAAGTLDRGSARLYVEDTKIASDKAAEFEGFATQQGAKIDSYVDIHMDQVFFKGTGNDDDVWANPMNDLTQAASIKLKLDDYNGEDIVLVHNIHNGTDYEEIPLTYNAADGTYEGKVTSFSNFAIAKKTAAAATTTSAPAQKVTVAKSPKTDDITNIIYWIMMGIGAVIVVFGINNYAQKMTK